MNTQRRLTSLRVLGLALAAAGLSAAAAHATNDDVNRSMYEVTGTNITPGQVRAYPLGHPRRRRSQTFQARLAQSGGHDHRSARALMGGRLATRRRSNVMPARERSALRRPTRRLVNAVVVGHAAAGQVPGGRKFHDDRPAAAQDAFQSGNLLADATTAHPAHARAGCDGLRRRGEPGQPLHLSTADALKVGFPSWLNIRSAR